MRYFENPPYFFNRTKLRRIVYRWLKLTLNGLCDDALLYANPQLFYFIGTKSFLPRPTSSLSIAPLSIKQIHYLETKANKTHPKTVNSSRSIYILLALDKNRPSQESAFFVTGKRSIPFACCFVKFHNKLIYLLRNKIYFYWQNRNYILKLRYGFRSTGKKLKGYYKATRIC